MLWMPWDANIMRLVLFSWLPRVSRVIVVRWPWLASHEVVLLNYYIVLFLFLLLFALLAYSVEFLKSIRNLLRGARLRNFPKRYNHHIILLNQVVYGVYADVNRAPVSSLQFPFKLIHRTHGKHWRLQCHLMTFDIPLSNQCLQSQFANSVSNTPYT